MFWCVLDYVHVISFNCILIFEQLLQKNGKPNFCHHIFILCRVNLKMECIPKIRNLG